MHLRGRRTRRGCGWDSPERQVPGDLVQDGSVGGREQGDVSIDEVRDRTRGRPGWCRRRATGPGALVAASPATFVAHLSPRRPGFTASVPFPMAVSHPVSKNPSCRNDCASRCEAWFFQSLTLRVQSPSLTQIFQGLRLGCGRCRELVAQPLGPSPTCGRGSGIRVPRSPTRRQVHVPVRDGDGGVTGQLP